MSTIYIALGSIMFLLAAVLSLGTDEPPLSLYLSAIYCILMAIYYREED